MVSDLKNAQHSGMPDEDEYEESKVSELISGVTAGVKRGAAGSLADRNLAANEMYTAMPDQGCSWQRRLVQSVLGQDDAQGNRLSLGATPESTRNEQVLTLESGEVKVKATKYAVPIRQTWNRWVDH